MRLSIIYRIMESEEGGIVTEVVSIRKQSSETQQELDA